MSDAPPAYADVPLDTGYTTTQFQPQPQPQQVVVIQQPQPQQQVIYVDQNGNPIQQPQQPVVIMQQPVNSEPPTSTQQAVELQVANNSETVPLSTSGAYAAPDDKHQWHNDDELPPDYESIIAGEATKEEPKSGMGYKAGCMATPHCKAWFFTILVLFFVVCYFICLIFLHDMCRCDCWSFYDSYCTEDNLATCDSYDVECGFPCSMTYKLGAGFWGIVAAAYLFYLIEVFCCSSSFKYLRNIHIQETVYKYIERLHSYPPTIWWRVECYHYETRTRTVTDSNGNTRTETYTERVVTHTASANYIYNSWKDVSMPMTGLDEYKLTKLTNYKTFSFANTATENDYNYKAAEFRRMNDFDVYQSFWYGVEVQDFKKKMLVEVEPGARGKAISCTCYTLSSLILLTTCFRVHFAAVCGRKKYVLDKQVSI